MCRKCNIRENKSLRNVIPYTKRDCVAIYFNFVVKTCWNFSRYSNHNEFRVDGVQKTSWRNMWRSTPFPLSAFLCTLLSWLSEQLHFVFKLHTRVVKVKDCLSWVFLLHRHFIHTRSSPPLRGRVTKNYARILVLDGVLDFYDSLNFLFIFLIK